jgi:hypothetical protein
MVNVARCLDLARRLAGDSLCAVCTERRGISMEERFIPMRALFSSLTAICAGSLLVLLPVPRAAADEPNDTAQVKATGSPAKATKTAKARGRVDKTQKKSKKDEQDAPEFNLLNAVRDGRIVVRAEGRGDGRMTVSLTNRTRQPLRVILPPGIIAQSATGQFGGMGGGMMGGMGGGMGGMGGGMGGMGGGMGGMGGGMGGMGGGNMGMGGMGGMGRASGTMPATVGMMMLARMIMYFCGDPESWDMRSLMIGMMGGMGMGGMGGMGMGGMGGGMGMGGMGAGMRSVPATQLPSALLSPGQTRNLPTRLVSLNPPDPEAGLRLPEQGEPIQLLDVTQVNDNSQVQKALRRLQVDKAPTSLSQLVMWRVASGLDWDTISQYSGKWANGYELTLAKEFVEHLDAMPEGETGRVLIQVDATDTASEPIASEFAKAVNGKTILGLIGRVGQIPARPDGPAVACRVKLNTKEGLIQVTSTDAAARKWIPYGKFTVPVAKAQEKFDVQRFADGLAEGVLTRLVRAQVIKGTVREKGKLIYQVRIENASPWILEGIAILGTASKADDKPDVLQGLSLSPWRALTVPMFEDVVKTLGLKKGIKLVALDLSGL